MSPFTWIASGEEGGIAETYFSVPTASLVVDTVTDFDFYTWPDAARPPVLYRERELPFSQDVLDRLRASDLAELYVKAPDEAKFQRYVASNLRDILRDDTKDADEKAQLAYYASQRIVSDLFDDPRLAENIQRTKAFVEDMTEYMLQDATDLKNLMRVMSFDYDTYTHSVNVFVFCIALARQCGIEDIDALRELGEGALLHDIGKSVLDSKLVNFEGKFSREQYERIKEHTVLGYELLAAQKKYSPLTLSIVRSHHEKLDGTGYPDGLKGHEINPFVRICAIAEIFDAMTTKRPYKDADRSFNALMEMRSSMLPTLDGRYFTAFVELLGQDTPA